MGLKINGVRIAGIGADGRDGLGVPSGGTDGQVLIKKSVTDYDTEWTNLPSVPTKTSDLTNDSDFVTTDEMNATIAAIPAPDMSSKQDKITGTAGQFVVIGSDGNVTTKTIANAEEVGF